MGQKPFLLRYYFLTGVGAGLINVVVKTVPALFGHGFSYVPTIGASGAIFGILIACAILFPDRRVYLFPIGILADKGFYPQNKLLGSKREQSRVEAEITATKTEIALNLARIDEARLQIRQIYQQRQEQNAEALAKQRGQNSDYREKLAVANDVLNRVDVRAPRAGVVQGIKFHALGAVVKPGDTLAEVIPISDNLVLSAKIIPTDINNVAVGQTAEVRFPAFAYKHLPAIFGQVRTVSADSLVDDESPTKQHYYKAKVIIDQKTIPAEIAGSLVPGMPADVVIITGERTLLQYLLGPVIQRLTVGMREK